jgi:hypothetical protein
VRPVLLFGHLLGFVLWLGADFAAMPIGAMLKSAGREETNLLLGLLARLYRAVLLPGVVLTLITGLLLTLRLYSGPVSAAGYPVALMIMQGAGLVGGAIAIGVTFPATTRLARLDPHGPHAAVFAGLRNRASVSAMIAGTLGMVALVAAAFLRS